jgi:hypothetical protein
MSAAPTTPDATAVEVLSPAGPGTRDLAAALRGTSAELVSWVPAGDELLPDALAKLGRAFDGRPEVVLVYPSYLLVEGQASHRLTEGQGDGSRGRAGETERQVVPEEMSFTEMLMFQEVPVGPGAVFRRAPALAAAEASSGLGAEATFSFWLRLAATGGVVRLLEPLARRRAVVAPAGDPRERARERLDLLEAILTEVELPDDRDSVRRSAARSACVLAALDFEGGPTSQAERFSVADRFDLPAPDPSADLDAQLASLEARIFVLDQLNNRTRAVLPVLGEILAQREETLARAGEPADPGGRGARLRKLVGR